jgi:FMN phosphatase YigB (HAD superfamily)
MVRGVFFDAGNTIVFPDYSIYEDVAAALGVRVTLGDVVRAEALARGAFDRAVAESPGGVHAYWPVYYTPFYEHLGLSGDSITSAIEKTREANDSGLGIWCVPVDGFHETMDALDERGIVAGIISNSDGRLADRLSKLGLSGRFSFILDSAVLGVSKPDARIFETATLTSAVPAGESAYVGDYYEIDVVGARAVGMRPVLFDPVGAYGGVDCDTMRRFGDIVELVDQWNSI